MRDDEPFCVEESAHHALANAGGREIMGKKEGEQKGSARGSVHWGCYYATAAPTLAKAWLRIFLHKGFKIASVSIV